MPASAASDSRRNFGSGPTTRYVDDDCAAMAGYSERTSTGVNNTGGIGVVLPRVCGAGWRPWFARITSDNAGPVTEGSWTPSGREPEAFASGRSGFSEEAIAPFTIVTRNGLEFTTLT